MAKYINRNTYISINGTAYQDHATEITIKDEADKIDVTSFSANGYREFTPGLSDGEVNVKFFQDFSNASIHQVLQPLKQSGGTFAVVIRPDAASGASATNPTLTMTARLYSYGGLAGAVGAASEIDAVFANAGTAGLVWGTV